MLKNPRFSRFVAIIVAAACVTTALPSLAQQPAEPAILVQIKSAGELLDDVQHVAGLITGPLGAMQVQGLIQQFTQGQGLKGIDQTKPAGAIITFGDFGEFQMPVFFVPVTKADDFRSLLKAFLPQESELPNGIYFYQSNELSVYAKFSNGYCFLSLLPTTLEKLPDPTALPKPRHDIELVVNIGRFPPEFLTALDAQMQIAVAQARAQAEAEGQEVNEARRLGQETARQLTKLLFNETDRLAVAIDVNRQAQKTSFIIELTPKAGTPLAEAVGEFGKFKSQYGALIRDQDAVSVVYAYPLNEGLKRTYLQLLDLIEKEAAKEEDLEDREVLAALLPVARKCIEAADRVDAALRVASVDGEVAMIGVAYVPNSSDLETALLKAAENQATVARDIAQFRGAPVHRIDIPEQEFSVFIAAPENEFWVAIGTEHAVNLLAQEIETGPRAGLPPMLFNINVRSFLQFAATIEDDPQQRDMMNQTLQVLGDGPANLRITCTSDGKSFTVRAEVDEAVLRAIGVLATTAALQQQIQNQQQ